MSERPKLVYFGRNYAAAPDDFVYVHSPDADGACEATDRMVLARPFRPAGHHEDRGRRAE